MLKKHLKKIVSLVLVTMMAIGMSITAIAAEPYQCSCYYGAIW